MTISDSDYEKFRLKKMESLTEKDLSQFLIFDYFEKYNVIGNSKDNEKVIFEAMQSSIFNYNRYKFILYFLDKFPFKFFKNKTGRPGSCPGRRNKKILFQGLKYYDIVLGVKKWQNIGLIVQGNSDRIDAFKNIIDYMGINDLTPYVYNYLKEKNINHLHQLIKKTEDKLKDTKPDYIVLWNDVLPIERAIILASKKLGIITLEIQHGIYSLFNPLIGGKAVDYVLVWGKYFKDLYINQKIRKPEEIYVLGYPYLTERDKMTWGKTQGVPRVIPRRKNKNYALCYLGEDFERYNKSLLKIKLENVNNFSKMCKKLGLRFVYRPHPGDNVKLLKEKLPNIQFTLKREKIEETFKKADIFISFSSTSLIEAAMRQKISIQFMNYPFKAENFEKLGACNKTLQAFDELEDYLVEIANASDLDKFKLNFNNNYIETRYNPIERFLEIIKDIEER